MPRKYNTKRAKASPKGLPRHPLALPHWTDPITGKSYLVEPPRPHEHRAYLLRQRAATNGVTVEQQRIIDAAQDEPVEGP